MDPAQNTAQGAIVFLIAVYFAPAIIASARGHLSSMAITVLNALLGWTLLGWIVALVWSLTSNTKQNARRAAGLPPSWKPLNRLVYGKKGPPRTF